MNIRKANVKDLTNIAQLHSVSWLENYNKELSERYLSKEIFIERLDVWRVKLLTPVPNQLVLIAEIDSDFCGFICVLGNHHKELGSYIESLHIAPKYKGQGIGTQLLSKISSWVCERYNNHDLYLEVLISNSDAIKFYESKGAKNIGLSYWHTPCGNRVKQIIYSWKTPATKSSQSV